MMLSNRMAQIAQRTFPQGTGGMQPVGGASAGLLSKIQPAIQRGLGGGAAPPMQPKPMPPALGGMGAPAPQAPPGIMGALSAPPSDVGGAAALPGVGGGKLAGLLAALKGLKQGGTLGGAAPLPPAAAAGNAQGQLAGLLGGSIPGQPGPNAIDLQGNPMRGGGGAPAQGAPPQLLAMLQQLKAGGAPNANG